MRPAAQMTQHVYIETIIEVVDLDESVVDPTIVSETQPHVDYRRLFVVGSKATIHDDNLLPQAFDKLWYEVFQGSGLRPDELDIVRAVRKADHRKDETGNAVKLTLGEFIEAMKGMGIEFVESLEKEVVGGGK